METSIGMTACGAATRPAALLLMLASRRAPVVAALWAASLPGLSLPRLADSVQWSAEPLTRRW